MHSVDPQTLVGKTLTGVRRSSNHPTLTLDFSDHTTYQILVDGYNPLFPGVPKELEWDELFEKILAEGTSLALTVTDCALVTLSDRAFERRQKSDISDRLSSEDLRWDQNHLGVAFKFSEPVPRWHCVWAMLEDRDKVEGSCIFRSYEDVYLSPCNALPRKLDIVAHLARLPGSKAP
ncbi:hypothetical protein CPB85DRAFT_728441 [Mucidula mucida]|nr:hypothetical protein CPB85DRAFT_728441 [Mucidula mucida]